MIYRIATAFKGQSQKVPGWNAVRLGWNFTRIQWEGIVVAALGFAITRIFVAEAVIMGTAIPFLITGVVPLIVGLAVTVFGVTLAIGAFTASYTRHVSVGALIGTSAMVMILLITAFGEFVQDGTLSYPFTNGLLVANVMLGGIVGGMVIGHRSAESERQRQELNRKSNRSLLVNRLLKHDVINAITIVGGYTTILAERSDPQAHRTIQTALDGIERTIHEIGTIADETERPMLDLVNVRQYVHAEIDRFDREQDLHIDVQDRASDPNAVAGGNLGLVIRELLENAADHGTTDSIAVDLDDSSNQVGLTISNEGPGLPETQRELLEHGTFPEYDDPTAGFGLQVVRLLVDRYGGTIRVTEEERIHITVSLSRARGGIEITDPDGVTVPNLLHAGIAGTIAGVAMGAIYTLSTGLLPVIGALYGVEDPIVGWITHLFHSIVFGLVFAAGIDHVSRARSGMSRASSTILGGLWGITLWLVAAGVVMPVWLRALGIEAAIPNLDQTGLVAHLVWGLVMAIVYDLLRQSRD